MSSQAAEKILEFEDDIDLDNESEESDPNLVKRQIITQPSDPQIDSLYKRWKRGSLILNPDFQRKFVWDRNKASKLVESALLSIPLPIIYLSQESNDDTLVIDGQQRLTSFFSFIDGNFPDGKAFKLTGLKAFSELNKKSFKDLDDKTKEKIENYSLRTVTFLKESDPEIKFEIFERLNMGAVPLNQMELRNCVFHGSYIKLLKDMATNPDFMFLLGQDKPDPRMKDVELVLRFAAFHRASYLKYEAPMSRFFNDEVKKYRDISETDSAVLVQKFRSTVSVVKSIFGDKAFKRFYAGTEVSAEGRWEKKKFNASLYDVTMGILCDYDKNRIYAALDALREGFIELMTQKEFIDTIEISTSSPDRVRKRFDMTRSMVDKILENHPKQERCFSFELKEKLFKENPKCSICGHSIQMIDDAALDHIHQYWAGGKTIPENARLAHRFCNASRSRND